MAHNGDLCATWRAQLGALNFPGAHAEWSTSMVQNVDSRWMQHILEALRSHPDGVGLGELHASVPGMSRRTLQRRLAALVDDGTILKRGVGRGTRYLPLDRQETPRPARLGAAEPPAAAEPYVPLSGEGEEILRYVRSPRTARQPVGYERALLTAYRPNRSFYLPKEARDRLMALGDAHDGGLPAGTYARQILNRLLIDLSWNSSRLEGNTYSLLETERLLQLGEASEGKDAFDAQMILNHKEAIEALVENASDIRFDRHTICNLHALLSQNLLPSDACGRIRETVVGIHGTVFVPLSVPQVLRETFDEVLAKAESIEDPFEQAFFVMVHLPYLQPFEDVNKRVSRLAANIPFIKRNLIPLSFVEVPERAYIDGILGVYELQRVELLRDVFVWAYERSARQYTVVRRSIGAPDPFRLRYREAIRQAVGDAVRARITARQASGWMERWLGEQDRVPDAARRQFIGVVEHELDTLHAGNIARYRLRPSEFEAWHARWRSGG